MFFVVRWCRTYMITGITPSIPYPPNPAPRNLQEEIEDVCDAADKQRKIERELREISMQWQTAAFTFQEWKQRGVVVLKSAWGFGASVDVCVDGLG